MEQNLELPMKYWKCRIAHKIKADEFARMACVNIQTLRKFEHGESVTKMTEEKIKLAIATIEGSN